ncbi:ISSod1, transposase OrfA [Sulfurimonas gotlandica GD1]|nr:ISSod1, transposase OrfA [Sulfurimonas gotlandica GD1]EDZ63764.1 ISSod1, transposase OrfA [Sulfurimonas gotlandica GD1]
MKNSQYTREFRDSTIQLVLNSGDSVLKIAKDLNVNPKTIYNWMNEYKKTNQDTTKPIAQSPKETLEQENKRLRRETKLLRQERDILKKAAVYFAKEVQ